MNAHKVMNAFAYSDECVRMQQQTCVDVEMNAFSVYLASERHNIGYTIQCANVIPVSSELQTGHEMPHHQHEHSF